MATWMPQNSRPPSLATAIAAQVMASATPPPAYSERVYQVIQPSLVLIQTYTRNADGKDEHGLGSGSLTVRVTAVAASLV